VGAWLFTSDLHGHAPFYEALVAHAAARRPSVVILGGDLGPHGSDDQGVRRQRAFFAGPFRDIAARLRTASPGVRLFVLMGNDDWAANHDLFEDGERRDPPDWLPLHDRVHELGPAEGGLALSGLSWVPLTPFSIKDWERWDTAAGPGGGAAEADADAETSGARLDGYRSAPGSGDGGGTGGLRPVRFDPADRSPTIADALEDLGARTDPARTVYVFHSPPFGTACDVIAGPRHVGSRAIRAFLERAQPPLSLSGHIHEAPRLSGRYWDRIGRTLVVQPGQFDGAKEWCAVTFDPADPLGTLEHTLRGRPRLD
jgi:Icc-related predicted phosphoesterase